MNNKKISIIACMGANNELGLNGQMPWGNLFKEDLKHFKKLTTGNIVIMGRKTYESIGSKPLPNRTNVVISRDWGYVSRTEFEVTCALSIKSAIDMFEGDDREVFIIGGADIYRQTIDIADTMYITRIHQLFNHDTKFPRFDKKYWKITNSLEKYDEETNFHYELLTYKRKLWK